MKAMRQEKDSLGFVDVPADHLWGAQTQRTIYNFKISPELVPLELIYAMMLVKKATTKVLANEGKITRKKEKAIIKAANEVLEGKWDTEFPLPVFQAGSLTPTHMNVNEVLANRASVIMGGQMGLKRLVHPNDDVNHSQSTNDVLPTAMQLMVAIEIREKLLPALQVIRAELNRKSKKFAKYIKIGRTHFQDAVPISVGQEFSAYVAQMDANIERVKKVLPELYQLPIGGSAVGTGLNADKSFAKDVVRELKTLTKLPLKATHNKFALMAAHDVFVQVSGTLKTIATNFFKLANDMRLLGSGPRSGLAEMILPENEPGSSIMPGKVNPTQCEAMIMSAIQVIGNDTVITLANARSELQLNVMKPIITHNLMQSIRLLSGVAHSFTDHLLKDLKVNKKTLKEHLDNSLMLVTCLTDYIGYDKAGEIALHAHRHHKKLKDAALELGYLTAQEFDRLVKPELLI